MIFYTAIDAEGRKHLTGTQADARAINKDFVQIDIPTDKAGLMAFVQNLWDAAAEPLPAAAELPPAAAEPPPPPPPTFIERMEREISVEEEIQSCTPSRLATLAQNVAWRFEELAKKEFRNVKMESCGDL